MLLSDLLHSCANECVAEAAVISIGGSLASVIQSEAEERGVSVGFLAASFVRSFARHASERDWRDLVEAVRGQDVPVLSGLRVILTKPSQGRGRAEMRYDLRGPALPTSAFVPPSTSYFR